MSLVLRGYQQESVNEARAALVERVARPVVCLPTGAGKTAVAAGIVLMTRAKGKRVGFAVDRRLLADQTIDSFAKFGIPEHEISVYGGTGEYDPARPVQVISQQFVGRNKAMPDLDLLIVDECHVLHDEMKRQILVRDRMRVVGLTATPSTTSCREFFAPLVSTVTLQDLINNGSLVDYRVFEARCKVDMSGAQITNGEFDEQESARRMTRITGDIVTEWERACGEVYGAPVPTIIFPVDVAHGNALVDAFTQAAHKFIMITSRTPATVRKSAFDDLEARRIDGLVSVDVLTKGFDSSAALCCILARPIASSVSLMVQMMGRVLRPGAEKPAALMLDFCGNFTRHGEAIHRLRHNGPAELFAKGEGEPREPRKAPKRHGKVAVVGAEILNEAGELHEVTYGAPVPLASYTEYDTPTLLRADWWRSAVSWALRMGVPLVAARLAFAAKWGGTPEAFGLLPVLGAMRRDVDNHCTCHLGTGRA